MNNGKIIWNFILYELTYKVGRWVSLGYGGVEEEGKKEFRMEMKKEKKFTVKRQTFQFLITEMGEFWCGGEEPKPFGKRGLFTLF